ncbi:MAG: sigma 54-interacting transcriptional regulator [Myxococcales bacterium]
MQGSFCGAQLRCDAGSASGKRAVRPCERSLHDARSAKAGLIASAQEGTFFLDEIGELALGLQPKLLRALQERSYRPVGGTTEIAFDARIIAATNRDLEAMVEEKRFREDLYFRINVIQLVLPPLRACGSDVLLLAQHFLERIATRSAKRVTGLSAEAAAKLLAYHWPGYARELENSMERAVALASFETITESDACSVLLKLCLTGTIRRVL